MLDRILKINTGLIIAAIVASVSAWRNGRDGGLTATISVAMGGALILVNFWAIKGIIGKTFSDEKDEVGGGTKALLSLAYFLKIGLLFGGVAAAIVYLKIDVVWFSVGISTLVLAVLLAGVYEAFFVRGDQ